MDTAIAERKVVPWFSVNEWNEVFKNVYSKDVELQKKAYKRMCVWKARYQDLPVGVESTMELLEVHLCDENNGSYSEKGLQLMYSTVMMRFLNHLKYLHKNKEHAQCSTMYRMATDYGIPDWIVNMRHEAAHGSNLPAISLLRTASDFAMEWLHDNYWMKETDEARSISVAESPFSQNIEVKLRTFLTLWQASKLYKLQNCNRLGEIPNKKLRYHLTKLYGNQGLRIDDYLGENNGIEFEEFVLQDGSKEENPIKTSKVIKILISILKNMLPEQRSNTGLLENLFAKRLVECELFLPKTLNSMFYTNGERLYGTISSFWHDVLVAYHEANLLTDLISELVAVMLKTDLESQQLVAACWLSHLCKSLCTRMNKVDISKRKDEREDYRFVRFLISSEKFSTKELKNNLSNNILHNIDFSKEYHLKSDILENVIREVIMAPNMYTSIYLSSLLDLLNPPLEVSAKENILQLVEVYTKTDDCEPEANVIYTTESLLNPDENSKNMDIDMEHTFEEVEIQSQGSLWTKNHGITGWSECAFGRLPDVV